MSIECLTTSSPLLSFRQSAARKSARLALAARHEREAHAATTLQRHARGAFCRSAISRLHHAASLLSACWKAHRARQLLLVWQGLVFQIEMDDAKRNLAALKLQTRFRGYVRVLQLRRALRAVGTMQRRWRGWWARSFWRMVQYAVVRLQCNWRGIMGMRKAMGQRVELLILIRLQSQWRSRKYKIAYNVMRSLIMTLEIQVEGALMMLSIVSSCLCLIRDRNHVQAVMTVL